MTGKRDPGIIDKVKTLCIKNQGVSSEDFKIEDTGTNREAIENIVSEFIKV